MKPTLDGCQNFLHVSLKDEVYVEQPEGFEVQNQKTHVCRLNKSLYVLK